MKRIFTLLFFSLLFISVFAQKNNNNTYSKIDSTINRITKKVSKVQYYADYMYYPELAYMRNKYNLPNLYKNDTPFVSKLNDYNYKRIYPLLKLINNNFTITEDCIISDNASKSPINKLLYYSINNTIKIPTNFVNTLDSISKIDDEMVILYWYHTLRIIYYLKQFNYSQLSTIDKSKVDLIEKSTSEKMYNTFIKDKKWGFCKITALAMLKINKNPLVDNFDITDLLNHYLYNGNDEINILDIPFFSSDIGSLNYLFSTMGADKMQQLQVLNTLWIILAEKKT